MTVLSGPWKRLRGGRMGEKDGVGPVRGAGVPAAGIQASNGSTEVGLVVPWVTVAVTTVGLPVLAVLGAYVLARPTPRWTRFTARQT
jgi:hypothetical protein